MTTQLIGAPTMNTTFERFSANTFEWDTNPANEEVTAVAPVSSADLKTGFSPNQNSLVAMMKATKTAKAPAKRKRRPSPPKKTTELPEDFVPSNYSVLCGKGSENYNAIGKST